jgi:thioredoxin reductase (NADPH)
MYLSRGAKSVTLLVRGPDLAASMSYYLIQQINEAPNISVRARTVVETAHGTDHLEQLTLRDVDTGETELVDAQWMFVFIGAAPLTDWLDGTVLRDEHGFILAGPDLTADGRPPAEWELDRPPYHLETNIPGVFVAGDARAESAKRVASAVGEGAMAVMLVHRYLEQS